MHTMIPTSRSVERFHELQHYVGNTPLYPITKLSPNPKVKIYAKLEWQQMGGSVKARPAYNIMKEAIESGKLNEGKHLLDATSGNTGIAYAVFASVAGIPLTLAVPGNVTKERKNILQALGVNLIFTSPFESTDGSQREALALASAEPDKYFYADQYNNDNNWKAHYNSTADEIIRQTGGQITHFVAGLGTTGTFTGTSRKLKEYDPSIQVIGLQPETALHGLEGWKHLETAKVPGIYDDQLADDIQGVDTLGAYEVLKDAARYESLFLSPSSAANLLGAILLAEKIEEGTIVTVFPDDATKYSEVVDPILKS
ncbi:PLP-dependent cysteine synthase family protein [Sanyastnella coralliicola]|uniref:PLP-dependent cysteine synthase family protein n=1 Tax=Sanyastnella coralliicola TaxID=3069118 RepID=UPI0027B8FA96|nr:cysteine synthase family protein [Longitalea sp. SCSIO 12813]